MLHAASFERRRIRLQVAALCEGRARPVDDDRAPLDKDAAAAYAEMASDLEARYHGRVTRHSSSAFTRIRPGRTKGRSATPHLVETAEDARAFLAARRQ